MSISFDSLMAIINDENSSKAEVRAAKSLAKAQGHELSAGPKPFDRFTVIDNNGAKTIAIRNTSRGRAKNVAISDLPSAVSEARKALQDAEDALAFAGEKGLL